MARCSEAALEASLRELSEHASGNKHRSNWLSVLLAAKRAAVAGYPLSINGTNRAVTDLFVIYPNHPRGRISPFVDLASSDRWLKVQNSGRSTVWNNGTRSGNQRILFVQGHYKNGLLPNAANIAVQHLGTEDPLPGRDALAVFLTRAHDWPTEPSRADLHAAAQAYAGLSAAEFEAISEDTVLPVPVLPVPELGQPEWSLDLLAASGLGPPAAAPPPGGPPPADDIPVGEVHELPERFRRFLHQHGIATESRGESLDLLAAVLSSQLVIMAGPSGSGKSLMAAALAAFFAPDTRRARLESSRLLAKREEFLGYYSHLAGQRFQAYDPLLDLLALTDGPADSPPMVIIEEANLSPIEGYLSPLVHGLGGLQAEILPITLHTQPDDVDSQVPERRVPRVLELRPYPRFFATINVDAESPAPARKVVSRACVVLLETPAFETALAAVDTVTHPSIAEAAGPAAGLIGRPTIAFDRYRETGSNVYEQALTRRAMQLRDSLGVDVIAHRALQRSLMYMSWYVELEGVSEAEPENETGEAIDAAVEVAADNALVHFVLPSLPAVQFERALEALDDGQRSGMLAARITRLRRAASEQQFGPPPDFWGALS
ncbi:hypothetical protein ACI796_02225 [Geodermatophilus sp. SYSU D00525]